MGRIIYWAKLTKCGTWGWQIDILSRREGLPRSLTMSEEIGYHAWTKRGALRRAARIVRRRQKRSDKVQNTEVIIVGEPGRSEDHPEGR